MAKYKFHLRNKNNPTNIYVRIRNGREFDLFIKTHLMINPKHWDEDTQEPKNTGSPELKKVYASILDYKSKLFTYVNSTDTGFVKEHLIKIFKPEVKPPVLGIIHDRSKLIGNYEAHIDYLNHQVELGKLKNSTILKYRVVLEIIKRMEKKNKVSYLINEIGPDFINEFEWYCQRTEKYNPNTIGRAIKFIKTVCLAARSNGIETHPRLDKVKGYTVKISFITLNESELETIENTLIETPHLDNARDWLLISCYTAQRISDFLKLTKANIEHIVTPDKKKVKIISLVQQKGGTIIKLPVSKKLEHILSKRNGHFPKNISDQKLNEYIKEVCKLAEINQKVKGAKMNAKTSRKEEGIYEKWELASSHIGRRSYATNNYGIIPTPVIMYATGHTTERSLLRYIGKSEDDKALQLLKYTEI